MQRRAVARAAQLPCPHSAVPYPQAEWHLPFARTQSVAREFAVKFASAVKKGYQNPPPGLPAVLPTLEFIECDIYVLGTGDERKSYFVEAMLPGDWRKFNNNAG